MTMVVSPSAAAPAAAGGKGMQGKHSQQAWGSQQSWGAQQQQQAPARPAWKEVEEANKKRLEAAQQKIAEQRKQQEELQKKRAEEQQKTQAAQRAAVNIRKVIARVRSATPETFEKLKEELAQTLAKEFDQCGAQKAKVQEESDKALEQASSRVEAIKKQKEAQEQKIKEMEQKRKEAEEKAAGLLKEQAELLEEAEGLQKELQETMAAFVEEAGKSEAEVTKGAKGVEDALKAADERATKSSDFLRENGNAMRMTAAPKKGQEEEKKEEEAPTYQKSALRLQLVKQNIDKVRREFVGVKEKALKKAGANETLKQVNAQFTKYDKDKDGMLSKKEIELFAKGEHKFTVPAEAIKRIFDSIVAEGEAGVKLVDFQRLKAAIGVARERVKDQEKRAAREKKEKVIAEQKAKVQTSIDEVLALAKAAEDDTTSAGKQSVALLREGKSMSAPVMGERAAEFETFITASKEKLAEVQKGIEGLSKIEVEDALVVWLKGERSKLDLRVKNLGNLLTKSETTLNRFKQELEQKDAAEVKVLCKRTLSLLREHLGRNKIEGRELYAQIDTTKKGIGPADFAAFCTKVQEEAESAKKDKEAAEKKEGEAAETESAEKEGADKGAADKEVAKKAVVEPIPTDDFKRVLKSWDDEEEGVLSEENFVRLLRNLKKVVKEIVITTTLSIKEGKTNRRLEVGEVVEILEGPVMEGEMSRVRARAVRDGVEGWVTVEGNAGTHFLEDGGGVYKVVKETILTESFEIGAPKEEARKIKDTTRKLKVGELVDVREWEKKDESTGLTRMKCKVRLDGLVGYLTTLGNTGIRFVEPV